MHDLQGLLYLRAQVHARPLKRNPALVDASKVQQIVQHPLHVPRMTGRDVQRTLLCRRVRGAFLKQKQRRGNSAEGIAHFVAEHREELVFRAVGLRETITVRLQALLNAGEFARGHANHLVDVLDDHSAVARIEEMVQLNGPRTTS